GGRECGSVKPTAIKQASHFGAFGRACRVLLAIVPLAAATACSTTPLPWQGTSFGFATHSTTAAATPEHETHRPRKSPRWASHSREGRAALTDGRHRAAEEGFVAALAVLNEPHPGDVRVATTLGNLVRLASVYQRLDKLDDAARVLTLVNDYTSTEGRDHLKPSHYESRYQDMNKLSLEHPYRPGKDDELTKYAFQPTINALIRRTALRYQVDPHLVKAVIAAESNFETLAVSHAGAQGLMQLMPATAKEMGVDAPFKPSQNIQGGVRYLRELIDRYTDISIAVAAYNAGPVAVDRYGGIPPYPETEAYVKRVLRYYREYRDEEAQALAR
ncbi:MAG: hypothetical protein ACI9QQ_001070, partial [Myxococcota bacterium]